MSETAFAPTPYKGLMPYTEEDAPFFFGREAEREIITANLLASRLTLLYGASGVGKSSVLRAGVAYHLRQLAQQNLAESGTPEFVVVVFSSWRDDPVVGMAGRIQDCVTQALNVQTLEPVPPLRSLAQTLQAWTERVGGDLLIILDQFEEYFLYHPDEDGEGTFAVEFPRAVDRPDLRVSFLISIREDALAKLDRFKGRIPNLFDNYLRIEHLDREAARTAIEEPIQQYNRLRAADGQEVSIEQQLVEAVLAQVEPGQILTGDAGRGIVKSQATKSQIETPYLQLVMTRLWDEEMRAGSHTLRIETLDRLGRAKRIVETHLDEVMSTLPAEEQEIAARVFHYLVSPSGTKIAYTSSDLATYAELPEAQLTPVLEELCGGGDRILRPVAPPPDQPTMPRYEIFHDVLAPAILDWRARYLQQQELAEAEKREAVRQRELEQAQTLAEEQRRRAEEQARVAQRLRRLAVALVVVSLVVVVVGIYAWTKRGEAVAAQRTAERQARLSFSRELAAAAINNLGTDPERSGWLALHAASVTYAADRMVRPEAENALHHAVQALRVRLTLTGHTAAVFGVAFSPDGTRLATASRDGTAKVWDTSSGQELLTLTGHTNLVYGVAFSPDGTRLATASYDETAKVWDASSGQELLTLTGHTDAVYGIAFSPDGTRLATASTDGTAKVWDTSSGQELLTLTGHTAAIYGVAFSPDGTRLATASYDGTAKVWDTSSGRQLLTLTGHTAAVVGVAFSPDGTRLATTSRTLTADHRMVKVWDASSGRELLTLTGHTDAVFGVAFSPDGTRLATASDDGTAKVWDASSGQELLTLTGHTDAVVGVAFSPDGTRLATASLDRTAKVWDASSGQKLLTLTGHTDAVVGVAFSPDGTRLATASYDETAKVWDTSSGQELFTLIGHFKWVRRIAFSRDGARLATASTDGTAKVWDASSGQKLLTLAGHMSLAEQGGAVFDVAFSPDGTRLATASRDQTAKVWDASSGQELLTLAGHTSWVAGVAFSPDGTRLATASRDQTAKVWDASSGQELFTLIGHTAIVRNIAFSHDGARLATASEDGTVRVFTLNIEELMAFVRARITRSLTSQECQKYLHKEQGCPLVVVALNQVVEGNNRARGGDVGGAIASLRSALELDPTLQLNPEADAVRLAAEALLGKGQSLAKARDVGGAIASLRSALELDPTLQLNPEADAVRLAAEALVGKGSLLVKQSNVKDAIAAYTGAEMLDPTLKISARSWNTLCWFGSLWRHAGEVMFACERAIELKSDNKSLRQSRGLARAMTGDIKGAIEDFQEYVKKVDDRVKKSQRQRWIDALQAGEDPFTDQEIKMLFYQ